MIFVEIKRDEVEKEVNRLQNIKLKRHDKMKQKNSLLIAKKVVKISFVCEQFSLLGKNEKSMFLSFSDSFKYFENKEDSRFSLDIEAIEALSGKQCLGRKWRPMSGEYSIQTVLRPGSTIICPASIIPVIRMQSLSGTTRRTHKT